MNAINWKKLLLPNIPYLLFVYCALARARIGGAGLSSN